MFIEELKLVKNSEAEAEQIVKNAQGRKKKILEDAKAQAQEILDQAEVQSRKISDQLASEAEEVAADNYHKHMDYVEDTCRMFGEKAARNRKETIAYIAERIVRDSVNY